MNAQEEFFKTEYIPILKQLSNDQSGLWGVLGPQGMVEHMTDSIGIAYGRIKETLQTPEAILPKVRAFALSEALFKENTKNSLMSETPAPLRNHSMEEAVIELEKEISTFLEYYKNNPSARHLNPFFGEFNYQEWLHILYKHATHHLKQFNLV